MQCGFYVDKKRPNRTNFRKDRFGSRDIKEGHYIGHTLKLTGKQKSQGTRARGYKGTDLLLPNLVHRYVYSDKRYSYVSDLLGLCWVS